MSGLQYDNNVTTIRENLNSIIKHLTTAPKARPTNDMKASVSKIHNLVLFNNNAVERFYFITLLCKLCSQEKPNKVEKLFKVVFPVSPTPQSMALVSDIISFALCYSSNYGIVLDNLSSYMNSTDIIKIAIESWDQAESLALDSPSFCAALLSRQDLLQLGIPKTLLAKWLQDLSKIEQGFPQVNLSQIIKLALVGNSEIDDCRPAEKQSRDKKSKILDTTESDLHFCILTLIQSRKCLTLTNQFLIEIANSLSQKLASNEIAKTDLVLDRFGQIVSVAAASKTTTITTSLRAALAGLNSNQLIAAVIKWQNK